MRSAACRLSISLALLVARLAAPSAAQTAATPEAVAALARRLPALDPSERGCPPFIARGSMPMPSDGYDYEVVWLGKEFRVTLFDAEDGLPLAVCTRRGSAVFDVVEGTPAFLSGGRLEVSVESSGDDDGGLVTTARGALNDTGAAPDATRFDIRDAVLACRDRSTIETLDDGGTRLTQRVNADRTRVVIFAPPPSRNVSFAQVSTKENRYTSYHELNLDGFDPADPSIASPDLKRAGFRAPANPEAFLRICARFEQFAYLGAIRGGTRGVEAARQQVERYNIDWDEAKAHGDAMREPWLARLRACEVTLAPPEKPWLDAQPAPLVRRPATQPTTAAAP